MIISWVVAESGRAFLSKISANIWKSAYQEALGF